MTSTRAVAFIAVVLVSVVLGAVAAAAATPAGPWRLVYATEVPGRRGLDVYVIDVPGGTPRRVAGVAGRNDFSPAWSPDGSVIAFRRNPVRGDAGEILGRRH